MSQFYTWWGDSNKQMQSNYWVHDDPQCRMAAALEGYTLFKKATGDNPSTVCMACHQYLKDQAVHNETERTQESRERVEALSESVAEA